MDDLISRQAALTAISIAESYEPDSTIAALSACYQRILNLPPAQQWTPVSERLPEVGETVLLACKEYGFNCCEYMTQKIGIYNTNCGNIVAWMPLPEPYKEEKG